MNKSKTTPLKIRVKTPLKLRTVKTPLKSGNTPQHTTNDRYIPNRTASDMEISYHLLYDSENNKNVDHAKRQLISETCNGVPENAKVLNLRTKPVEADQAYADNMKTLYHASAANSVKKATVRTIPSAPDKILDAPEFKDDYCKCRFR
jgi:cell division cycle protein 20 (cofactor of APC complex)